LFRGVTKRFKAFVKVVPYPPLSFPEHHHLPVLLQHYRIDLNLIFIVCFLKVDGRLASVRVSAWTLTYSFLTEVPPYCLRSVQSAQNLPLACGQSFGGEMFFPFYECSTDGFFPFLPRSSPPLKFLPFGTLPLFLVAVNSPSSLPCGTFTHCQQAAPLNSMSPPSSVPIPPAPRTSPLQQ